MPALPAYNSTPMRLLTATVLLIPLLTGCPANRGNVSGTAGSVPRGNYAGAPASPGPLSTEASLGLRLLCEAIDGFRPGVPPSQEALIALELAAKLPELESDSRLAPLKDSIVEASHREQAAKGQPQPLLLAALLRIEPDAAADRIRQLAAAGDATVFAALRFDAARASLVLERLDAAKLNAAQAGAVLDLLRELSASTPLGTGTPAAVYPGAELLPLLTKLAARPEPEIALRACGYLLRLKPGDSLLHDRLWQALRDAKAGEMAAAAEGARISADPGLADALIPLAMSIPLRSKPGAAKTSSAMLYATYTLSFLPGGQADLMRSKLTGAADSLARCQVRLGVLLAGDPGPWMDEVNNVGIDDRSLWIALRPPEAVSPQLLDTYALAEEKGGVFAQGAAAEQLNRYGRFQSKDVKRRAARILQPLLVNQDPEVRAAAWYTACSLGLPPPEKELQDALRGDMISERIRLTAAYLALRAGLE